VGLTGRARVGARHHRCPHPHPARPLYQAAAAGLPTLADPGYDGAGIGILIPVKQPAGGGELDINTRTRNAIQRPWAAWRDLCHLDPGTGQHRVERVSELPGPVPDQEPEPGRVLAKIHQQVPRLLHCPRCVWVRGHAKNVDVASTDLDDEEHIDPVQGDHAVHVEEAARQHRGCLGMQEAPPGGVAALRRWRDPVAVSAPAAPWRRSPGCPGRATHPRSAGNPSLGYPGPSVL